MRCGWWRGWYDALADLLPMMPDSEFAPWQLQKMPAIYRSMLVSGGNADPDSGAPTVRPAHQPSFTVTQNASRIRAFLVSGGNSNSATGECTTRDGECPAFTITASADKVVHRAWLESGRVVRITPRALARLQSFSDTYVLPHQTELACRLIGNAVPPLAMEQLLLAYEAQTSIFDLMAA